jgi:hypothetical protein
VSAQLSASLPEDGNSQLLKHLASLKKLDSGQSPKKKIALVTFSHALIALSLYT